MALVVGRRRDGGRLFGVLHFQPRCRRALRKRGKQMSEPVPSGQLQRRLRRLPQTGARPQTDPRQVGNDLGMAVQCLQRLNRVDEIDALLEDAVKVHKDNWRLLWQRRPELHEQSRISASSWPASSSAASNAAAATWSTPPSATASARLQLMVQAMPLAMKDENHAEVGDYPAIAGRHVVEQPRLRRGVAAAIPDRSEGAARLRAGLGIRTASRRPVRRSMPTAIRSSITCPRVSRRPRPTASAGGGASSKRSR